MNKACLLLTAGLMATVFAAGNAVAASDSDQGGESHPGWKMVNAGEGRKVPVRTYESWSRAYARARGGEASSNGGHGHAAYRAGWGYPWWAYGYEYPYYGYGYGYPYYGYGAGAAGAALGAATLGALGTAGYGPGWW